MNPLKKALDSKLGRYLTGTSVVDNAANPLSALNRRKKLSPLNYESPQGKRQRNESEAAFNNTKVFGAPPRK